MSGPSTMEVRLVTHWKNAFAVLASALMLLASTATPWGSCRMAEAAEASEARAAREAAPTEESCHHSVEAEAPARGTDHGSHDGEGCECCATDCSGSARVAAASPPAAPALAPRAESTATAAVAVAKFRAAPYDESAPARGPPRA